jgi:hypothetical protein
VKRYEKASNAKLNTKKSQIISFGKQKTENCPIEECKKDERVRHLGFYFNKHGLINNIDEILDKILSKLKILRNLFPNFTTRVNIWKGYAMSSLLYQSEVIVMSESQIKKFERMESWFLFSNNLNDVEINTVSDLKKIIPNISLDRLELPRRLGGMNLRRIEKVFSASKTKVIMRALQDNKREKPCNILLFEKSEEFFKNSIGKDQVIHYLLWVDEDTRKINTQWDWFKQASKIYNLVDKDCQFSPKTGDAMYDAEERIVYYFQDQNDIDLYQKQSRTFPIKIDPEDKERLIEKKEIYLQNEQIVEAAKIVSIGHRDQCMTPRKAINVQKADSMEFIQKVRVTFNQMEEKKLKKINLRNIFKITVDENIKPLWTDKHKEWREKGYKLKSLFSKNLRTVSRIEDFRIKFLMSYWKKRKDSKCELCGAEWHREHLFNDCEIVEKWENTIYGELGENDQMENEKRRIRKEALFDSKSKDHTFSWIYNWCIWKTYWEIVFQKFEKHDEEEKQSQIFKKHLKTFEYLHLLFSIYYQSKNHNLENVKCETEHFHFYSLSNSNKKGVIGHKGKSGKR